MTFGDIFKKSFIESYNGELNYKLVLISLFISLLLALIVMGVYYYKSKRYFYSKEFATALIVLAIITSGVILTIQSSIVVSLGMVGALSIVRFRTAIKNPMDLVFLFWSISVGIICGAMLFGLAIILTVVIAIIVLAMDELPVLSRNKILVLNSKYPYDIDSFNEILKDNVRWWNIRTESISHGSVNLVVEVKIKGNEHELLKKLVEKGFDDVSIIKQEGIVD